MTHQCMQCGSQTRAGAKFCHQCGTPIATTSLPPTMPFATPPPTTDTPPTARFGAATEAMPAPSAYLSQMPQTYQAPMPMPPMPPQKARSGFKIVLITLSIIFALGVASVIGAAFFIRNKVEQARRDRTLSLPTISEAPESVPDDKLGAPPYPGAKRTKTVSGGFGPFGGSVVEFTTSDSVEKVADFYRDHFRDLEERVSEINDEKDGKPSVIFTVGNDAEGRVITITKDDRNSRLTKIVMLGGGVMAPPPPRTGRPGSPPDMAPPPPPPPDMPPPRR